jgi:hypothetical protein
MYNAVLQSSYLRNRWGFSIITHQLLTRVVLITNRCRSNFSPIEQTGSHILHITVNKLKALRVLKSHSLPSTPYPMGEGHALFDVDTLLELQDDSNVRIPGLLCRLLFTRLGIVNGARSRRLVSSSHWEWVLTSDRGLESFLAIIDPCRRWMMINSEFYKKNCPLLPRMGKL